MSTFPRVDTKPLPSQDATAQEAPEVAPKAAAPTPEEYGHQQFRDFLMTDREIPVDEAAAKAAADGATAGETMDGAALGADAADAAHKKGLWNWFKGAFSSSDEPNPASMDEGVEMNDAMYDVTAELATLGSDIAFPKLVNAMHGTDDESQYKASEENKGHLKKAWALFLRTTKKKLSPFQYLVFMHVIVYGAGLLGGLFKYLMRIGTYGFHWPWSTKWKAKEAQANATARGFHVDNLSSAPMPPAQAAAPAPAEPAPQPIQPQPLAPAAQPEPTVKPLKNAKACLQTGEMFEAGSGRPAKSKLVHNGKKLQDAFIDATAFNRYMAANGLRGLNTKKA